MANPNTQDEDEFAAGFNEEPQDAAAPEAPAEDDFGLTPDDEPTEAVTEDTAAAAVSEPAEDGPAQGTQGAEPRALTPEEQRLKSWEGRLKARDAQGVSVEKEEAAEPAAEEAAESPAEEMAEEATEKLKGMDPDEALAALANDFGDDFTSMLASIIDAKVAKATGGTDQTVQQLLAEMTDTKERAHFSMIAGKHPDFMQVAQSQEFNDAIASLPEDKQAEVQKVISEGSAKEIIDLLDGYKASVADKGKEDAPEVDAAEGVRSGPTRIPTQPAASDDYSAAWDEFN